MSLAASSLVRRSLTRRVEMISCKERPYSRLQAKIFLRRGASRGKPSLTEMKSCGVAGAPCSLEVVATDRAIQVEDLSCKE